MVHVTLEGKPVEEVIQEEARAEAREQYERTTRALAFVVAHSRGIAASGGFRNH